MIDFRLEELNPRFLSAPFYIYGRQVLQSGGWFGLGSKPAYAKIARDLVSDSPS